MREGTGRRRLAAGLSLLATAAGAFWLGVRHVDWFDWHTLAFAGGLAAAAVGLTRKHLATQIVSRSMAWLVLAPTGILTTVEGMRGHLDLRAAAFAVTSGAALALAHAMLDTPEARAAFHPSKFRRSFLAACTAASTIAVVVGIAAFEGLRAGEIGAGLGLGILGMSILASALGVLRMRAWGIALAALSSVVSLISGMFVGSAEGIALAATALPGLLFLLPIVLAKLGLGEDASAPCHAAHIHAAHIAAPSVGSELVTRVRVAANEDELEVEEEHAALRAHAEARADV